MHLFNYLYIFIYFEVAVRRYYENLRRSFLEEQSGKRDYVEDQSNRRKYRSRRERVSGQI